MKVKEWLNKELSNNEIKEHILHIKEKAKKLNKDYNFMITFNEEDPKDFQETKLKGLVVSVKDCFTTKNMRTTAGSKILEDYVPTFDATIVKRLKDSGAYILGKTAMDEFGFGSFSTNCAFKVPKNANDVNRVAGGSSGGAGVITQLLREEPHIAIAESTGGSISNPAAFNGVYSITPTYGLLSRYGLIDYANTLDKPGVMASSAYDLAFILNIIKGRDERDPTTHEYSLDFLKTITSFDAINSKIAIIKDYEERIIDEEIKKSFKKVIDFLIKEGAEIEEISLRLTDAALASYYIIATAEASTNLAKYCGMRYGKEGNVKGKHFDEYFSEIRSKYFGEEVKRRIILGSFVRMAGYRDAYYIKALKVRSKVIKEFKQHLQNYDFLLAPTMPILPPTFDEVGKLRPHEIYALDVLTVPVNLAGLPHVNVPLKTTLSLPAGLHVISDHFKDANAVAMAYWIEKHYKGIF